MLIGRGCCWACRCVSRQFVDQTYPQCRYRRRAARLGTMWGTLQKLSVTVNTAYTGSLSSTMTPNTLHSDQWSDHRVIADIIYPGYYPT